MVQPGGEVALHASGRFRLWIKKAALGGLFGLIGCRALFARFGNIEDLLEPATHF